MDTKRLETIADKTRPEDAAKLAAAVAAAGAAAAAGKVGWDRLRQNGREHAFRIEEGEKLPEGIRGVLAGQVDKAASHLEGREGEPPDEAVHQARKCFKRSRATIRLAREELGEDAFARENERYRDLGRKLSGVRDADVLIATLDGIASRSGREGAFAGLRELLVADRDEKRARLLHSEEARADALERLGSAREAIGELPLDVQEPKELIAGFRRTYRDGRRAARQAGQTHSTEALHEWRKRVKDLWHQCQVLEQFWPKRMQSMAEQAHDLSDLLGEDHDLAVLAETAEQQAQSLTPDERRILDRGVRKRRKTLQKAADEVGAKLYAERPRRLADRLEKRARAALASS